MNSWDLTSDWSSHGAHGDRQGTRTIMQCVHCGLATTLVQCRLTGGGDGWTGIITACAFRLVAVRAIGKERPSDNKNRLDQHV